MIITRMPPSPTGPLHLGTARTALFNYLFAKHQNGKIIFRWEDTDKERSKTAFESEILEGLKWLGMDFQKESEKMYRQTENEDFHQEYLQKLWEREKIFPCFVTPEEIETQRQNTAKAKQNFVFWSPFREMSRIELDEKMKSGERYVWRLRCPKEQTIIFHDLVRGKIETHSSTLGDFVVARSDGSVLYPLANVLDDWSQGVTHVLRGEDHISNTPKQILLYQALNVNPPSFGHIPLVLDQNKRKLSKRNVDPSVCVLIKDFQEKGFVSEAVVNGLALLGWNPKTTEEIFSLEQLEKVFDIAKVNPAAAQYDFSKMEWFNAQWIRTMDLERLIEEYNEFAKTDYSAKEQGRMFDIIRQKARSLIDIKTHLTYFVSDPGLNATHLQQEKMGIDASLARKVLQEVEGMLQGIEESQFTAEIIKEAAIKKIEDMGLKTGQFLHPFRIALSNAAVSVGPFEIAEVIGKKEALGRLQRACKNN